MNSRRNKPYSRQLKGIDAYIGETAPTPNNTLIPIAKIQLSSQQPRRYFAPDKLKRNHLHPPLKRAIALSLSQQSS